MTGLITDWWEEISDAMRDKQYVAVGVLFTFYFLVVMIIESFAAPFYFIGWLFTKLMRRLAWLR